MQRLRMKNNKIRYKSMKRSSPLVQYKRMLLGKRYQNGKGTMPRGLLKKLMVAWDEYEEIWSHVQTVTIEREEWWNDENYRC